MNLTWRQRFVLGIPCAREVLRIMSLSDSWGPTYICARTGQPRKHPMWRSVDRLWLDGHKALEITERQPFTLRGVFWLRWAGGLIDQDNFHPYRKGYFIRLTWLGQDVAKRVPM